MARPKRKSPALTRANQRLAGLTSIDEALDLGNGLSVTKYDAEIKAVDKKLTDYNKQLSLADAAASDLEKAEKHLSDLSDVMLKAVATKFGTNSNEYRKAGGTPKSEVRRGRKPAVLKAA